MNPPMTARATRPDNRPMTTTETTTTTTIPGAWGCEGGGPPPEGSTGLYHVAFVYPDRKELAAAIARLRQHGYAIDHATDHGATVSIYLEDPDGNGVELCYDRPRDTWFDDEGRPILKAERIAIADV